MSFYQNSFSNLQDPKQRSQLIKIINDLKSDEVKNLWNFAVALRPEEYPYVYTCLGELNNNSIIMLIHKKYSDVLRTKLSESSIKHSNNKPDNKNNNYNQNGAYKAIRTILDNIEKDLDACDTLTGYVKQKIQIS